jgi:hypothetical protein
MADTFNIVADLVPSAFTTVESCQPQLRKVRYRVTLNTCGIRPEDLPHNLGSIDAHFASPDAVSVDHFKRRLCGIAGESASRRWQRFQGVTRIHRQRRLAPL